MTAPRPEPRAAAAAPAAPGPWYTRTGLVFGALATVILLTLVLSPVRGRTGDPRLTTLSRQPQGAQAFADLAARLGWRVVRDSAVPTHAPLPTDRVYAILDPPVALTGREYSRVLDAVRGGAGLLVVHPGGGPIEDSLGVERSTSGDRMRVHPDAARECPADEPRHAINWPGGDVFSFWLVPERPLPADTVHWLPVARPRTAAERRRARADSAGADSADAAATRVDTTRLAVPGALGIPLGRGRVVVIADGDWLRNDVLRVCRWHAAVTSMRMLDWLAATTATRTLVVDEWHQGRGVHGSAMRALGDFLTDDPRGRMLAHGVVAALVLLAALAARAMLPAPDPRVERRSPFEHVGALARAYEEIGATRVVARRLVRGLRRRMGATMAGRDDDAFLAALADRHPGLAAEVTLVREAMTAPRTPAGLLEVGRAVAHIERTLHRA